MRMRATCTVLLTLLLNAAFGLRKVQLYTHRVRLPILRRSLLHVAAGTEPPPPDPMSGLQMTELTEELKNSFMSYAMSTILSRALPDIRDGMKPVHRRVLYAMQVLNLTPDSGYRKCARVVGEVLGKFHPHGDLSVYDALVRMAQDFVMMHPLVSGHGNFGSIDNDPAAAMRYTEAKLSNIAYDSLLADIKDDTVDFIDNFDGNEIEPVVLPARLPWLLLNGASGIAVGMATNIPPHNLREIADAIVALVKDPTLSDEDLFKIVPAPDFPTGGKIIGTKGAHEMYRTGHGSVVMRADTHSEVITSSSKSGSSRSRDAIVITKLPYMTNKASLLEKIADLVNDKKLDGISDLRDESDRDGIRVVIELKRDAVPALVQNNLFKKTALQTSFSGNMLALVDEGRQPMRVTLRSALMDFIGFRFKTIRRRSQFQLGKLKVREHIVQGLMVALARMDEVFKLLRNSKDSSIAKQELMKTPFSLSSEQADAILSLRLTRLTAMEEAKLKTEARDLQASIKSLSKVMDSDAEVYNIMVNETLTLKNTYGIPRQSQIWKEEAALSDIDLVANDRSVIMMTDSGYIKRLPIEEFEAQSRGTKGKTGAKLSNDEDAVSHFFACNDHDSILFVSNKGVAYSVKAYQIPLGSRIAKGVPLPQVLPINSEERITSVIPVDAFGADESLVLLTKKGYVKKTPLKAFDSVSARGLIIISLEEGDALSWARRCQPDEELLMATRDGFASRFSTSDLISTGRTSRGVRALNLRDGDEMADFDVVPVSIVKSNETSAGQVSQNFVLIVTEKGYGKRIEIHEFKIQKRGGKGVTAIKFKQKAGGSRASNTDGDADALSCMRICREDDDVVMSTSKGNVVRQRVGDLSIQSRTATGFLIQKLAKDDSIVMVDVVPPLIPVEQLPSSSQPASLKV